MIRRRFLYIFSISAALLFTTIVSCAQEILRTDTISVSEEIEPSLDSISASDQMQAVNADVSAADSITSKKILSGVELKVDYGKLLLIWTKFEAKYEVGLNIRFLERLVLAMEFGESELNPLKAYDNALYYTIKGMYGRVGLDYYMEYDPSNFYYVGLRYGMSNFEDEGVFLLDSDYWPEYQDGFGSQDVTASWAEIAVGTETYLKLGARAKSSGRSWLLIGWNARLRIITDFENREDPPIYAIPGYGRTFNNVAAAINFYIKFRLGS